MWNSTRILSVIRWKLSLTAGGGLAANYEGRASWREIGRSARLHDDVQVRQWNAH